MLIGGGGGGGGGGAGINIGSTGVAEGVALSEVGSNLICCCWCCCFSSAIIDGGNCGVAVGVFGDESAADSGDESTSMGDGLVALEELRLGGTEVAAELD